MINQIIHKHALFGHTECQISQSCYADLFGPISKWRADFIIYPKAETIYFRDEAFLLQNESFPYERNFQMYAVRIETRAICGRELSIFTQLISTC
jgi:hypothetical protein